MVVCYNNYVKINSETFVGTKPEFVLKTVFGYDSFRPFQKEIISEVLKGHDVLAIIPTGGGKSICYQIPALIMDGITIVVTPLISLMQDQVASLQASGIHAVFLNSTLDWKNYKETMDDIRSSNAKIVYVSPEGLATGKIRDLLSEQGVKVNCITVDEAHCVSEWGHDFRPDYLEIASIRKLFPQAVMLALTATATEQVRKDIANNLKLIKPKVFVSSFNRSNIYLEVQQKRNALDQIIECIKKHLGESGIIYCFSRKQVDELTSVLDKMGYSVKSYHAGLTDEVRAKNQDLFIKDEVQIMVATVAFGMGINKPNVRFVINYGLPKSLEVYYQEIGRAGRDGLPSSALLIYSPGDVNKIRYFFDESSDPYKAETLLQGMLNFAVSRNCRRQSLLQYFGEQYDPDKNSEEEKQCCCDICSQGELPLTDVTTLVQKLLCCIIRTDERFGTHYIIDILLGSRNKRIMENCHNTISTWGIGTEITKADWLALVDLLIHEDFLCKAGDFQILTITPKGRDLLSTREKVLLPIQFVSRKQSGAPRADGRFSADEKPFTNGLTASADSPQRTDARHSTHGLTSSADFDSDFSGTFIAFPKPKSKMPDYIVHKKNKGPAQKPDQNDAEAEEIVKKLKAWRKRKADEMNIPPYIIFGDKTMFDLAAKKPQNKDELLNVYGMGNTKVENFGQAILRIVLGE